MNVRIAVMLLGILSLSPFLLAYNTTPEKKECLDCHGQKMEEAFKKKSLHPPFSDKQCESCHDGKERKLISPPEKICLTCHSDKEEEGKKSSVHSPFKMGLCTSCHDPHSSDNKKLLTKTGGALCFTCHEEESLIRVKFTHFPAVKGNCLHCHEHHAGKFEKNLRKEVGELCTSCHSSDKLASHHASGVLPSEKLKLSEDAKKTLDSQGRIICSSCHNPHGNPLPFFLRKGLENGKLCYGCHKPD